MITIKSKEGNENNEAELYISKGTPHMTILLGIEMLIEVLLKECTIHTSIDDLLEDIKRIYERDNKEDKNNG